jgi:hypothetical protein
MSIFWKIFKDFCSKQQKQRLDNYIISPAALLFITQLSVLMKTFSLSEEV